MDFQSLKEQLSEQWEQFSQKVSENEHFQNLVERFQALSPLVQKLIVIALIALILWPVLSIPMGMVASSKNYESAYNDSRQLITELFDVARLPKSGTQNFNGKTVTAMKTQVRNLMRPLNLEPSQFTMKPYKGKGFASVPKAIGQESLSINFNKLNVQQIQDISEKLAVLDSNTKTSHMKITADHTDPHYFNVMYVVSSLSLGGNTKSKDSSSGLAEKLKKKKLNGKKGN